MKPLNYLSLIVASPLLLLSACSTSDKAAIDNVSESTYDVAPDSRYESSYDVEPAKPESQSPSNMAVAQSGIVTAGEWNDLANWSFWIELADNEEYSGYLNLWQIHPTHRVSVYVHDEEYPISNATVELIAPFKGQKADKDAIVWTSRTDNKGEAELWANLFENSKHVDFKDYRIKINGKLVDSSVTSYYQKIVDIKVPKSKSIAKKVEIAFIVDATGSMGDEISFLKSDLQSVIQAVADSNRELDIKTAAVFYRDVQDEYLVRKSDFGKLKNTMKFINKQNATGGGDFPEAVDAALDTAINKLDWSDNANARIAFLLLDAPPHHNDKVVKNLQNSITNAATKGIKIIPITASGIYKETEFLMRSIAMATNGTYSFITDDSGVGNPHIVASVGEYEVEKLNELMIRLIKENSEFSKSFK